MAAPGGESVPQGMRPLFDAVVRLTDAFCDEHLDEEYAQLCRQLTATLCRMRPSPLVQGRVETWACAVVHTIGGANFLFDRSQTPHVSAGELCDWFGVAKSTAATKAGAIRRMLGVHQGDPRWYRPSQLGDNPFAWLIEVDGLVVDARRAPRAIQERAHALGLIPYLPG